jgi:hypothetical protein
MASILAAHGLTVTCFYKGKKEREGNFTLHEMGYWQH